MVRVYKKIMAFIVMIAFLLHYASAYAVYGAEDIAVISNVIMNVGANETQRNLTWYSDSLEDGEVRYAKNNILNSDSFPSDYFTSKAIAVSTATDGYWSYKATLTGLEENASYSYCIVVGDTVSDIYTFNTKSFDDDFSFAFVTDPQVNSASDSTSWNDTLTKLSGDFSDISFIVSAGDQISSPTSETDYGYFFSDQLKSIAFAPSVGPGHDNASLYDSHFNLPNLSSGYGVTDTSSDYYYKYNDVLFMHLNAESNDYASHISFMENTISNNPDCSWKIVVIHYSFYTGGHHSVESAVRNCRNALAGKINELGVDLVLSGHDHLYARSKLMIGSNVVSDDVVVNNSATDPVGTLYLCGTSASGASYYDVESSGDDEFIASCFDDNCKGAVIFDVSETKLEMHSYFLDGNEPCEFDSFVINKSPQKLRLNEATDMLEFMPDGEKERIPLVNAYAYSDAVVRVINGSWSVSTDAGVTYQSLGIYSDANNYVIRINSQSGNWELSDDGGSSFNDTGICTKRYTVTYVGIPGASFGDGSENSEYNKRSITTPIPDPPVISLPKGSVSEGYLYEWSWEYYFSDSGIKATSFEYGNDYVAYLVCTKIPVSNIVRVGNATNTSENIYNWKDAWEVAIDCYDESLCLVLEEDIVLSSTDAITFTVPVDVTLDLNGHSIDTSACSNAFVFSVGSSGANFRVESLLEDGAVDAGSNNFIAVSSNSASKVNIWLGSSDSYPLNVKRCKNLVFFSNNFKHKSTVNLNIYSGIYNVSESVAYITNIYDTSEKNIYNINAHNAEFRFSKSGAHLFVPRANGFYANSASSFTAEGCSFVNTFSQSSINLLKSDCWLGGMSFTDSRFDGVSIDGSVLTGIKNITFSENCTFKNSSATFKSNSLEFSADYMKTDVGCVVAHTDGNGSSAIEKRENTAAITWSNPIGYTEY